MDVIDRADVLDGFSAITFASSPILSQLLSVLGRVKAASILSWIRVITLIPILYFAASNGDLSDVAMSRFLILLGLRVPTIPIFSYVMGFSTVSILG